MRTILIVEDETALRDVYAMLFDFEKFKVYEAANGKLALKQLQTIKPDVILLDVLMPVMGGIEFLEAAEVKKNYPDVKILVLSNLSDAKTRERVENLGASKYMLKAGVAPSELVKAVTQLLNN